MKKQVFLLVILAFASSLFGQNMGIKMAPGGSPNATLDVNGSFALREGVAKTLANGFNDNVAIDSMSFYRVTGPTAAFGISGFTGGQNGRLLTIYNATTQTMTLAHQMTSTAANQLSTGGSNTIIGAGGSATFQYNSTLLKWVTISTNGASPKFTTINEGNTSDSILVINNGQPARVRPPDFIETYAWGLDGNTGTTAGTNYLGTTDSREMVIKTNATEAMRFSTAQNAGIGLAPISTARLNVGASGANHAFYQPTVTNLNWFSGKTAFGPATSNPLTTLIGTTADPNVAIQDSITTFGTAIKEGLAIKMKVVPTADSPSGLLYGINARVHTPSYNTRSVGVLEASNFDLRHYGSGTITSAYGNISRSVNLGAGRMNRSFGVLVDIGNYGTGIIDSLWGIQIAQGQFGTPTNAVCGIGLHIGEVYATNAFGIFQGGSNDGNYFAGNVGIGIVIPNQQLEISQAFRFPATTSSTTGVIYKGANRFLHDYKPSANTGQNTFLGENAGNFSMTSATASQASNNSGFGYNALTALTTGYSNSAFGSGPLKANTSGYQNAAFGQDALPANTTGNNNTALGQATLVFNTTGSNNTAVGQAALALNQTGVNNTGIGQSCLFNNLTGTGNTALGFASLYNNTGSFNTALGAALYTNTTGGYNTATGYFAMNNFLNGSNNTATGYQALAGGTTPSLNTGSNNSAFGFEAMSSSSSGSNNTAIGYQAGQLTNTGSRNTFLGAVTTATVGTFTNSTAIGYSAAFGASNTMVLGGTGANSVKVGIGLTTPGRQLEITKGFQFPATTSDSVGIIYKGANRFMHDFKPSANNGNNTFLGQNAGNFTMTSATVWLASGNTGIGVNALTALTEAGYNSALGFNALQNTTSGSYNTAIGSTALRANTTGDSNTGIGNGALETTTTGRANAAIGNAALRANTTGFANVAVGESAMRLSTTGYQNVAIGQAAMEQNTTGYNNVSVGLSALEDNTDGFGNTALGAAALDLSTTGDYNTALGNSALGFATTANQNTAIGFAAGGLTTTGGNNVFVGWAAGAGNSTGTGIVAVGANSAASLTGSGTNVTCLGNAADVTAAGLSNATAIGFAAQVSTSNSMVLGGTGANAVKVGIATIAPLTTLDMDGGLSIRAGTTVSLTADNQAVTVGDRSFIRLSSNSTAVNRTFTLSSGLQTGQVLILELISNTFAAELADTGNCRLSALWNATADDTIMLIWNGAAWLETSRGTN